VTTTTPSIRDRIAALDWAPMTKDLDSFGCTIVKSVLTREECRSLAAMYERDDIFRSTIVMARHGFGRGEYKYWSYPLPEIVAGLRTALYPPLAAVANRAEVVSLQQGDGVAFAVSHRPVQGTKGTYRVNLRHGVSRLRSGHRNTMGIIFHDGK